MERSSWRELCKAILTPQERERMRASFDTIGDIAIVEIAQGLAKKERKLAKLLLDSQSHINVVAKKVGGHKGRFRHQPLRILAGEKRLVTIHKESGCLMKLNVQTCYFSPRLGTERLRIAQQIKPGEDILVLFAGIAPFPMVIARHAKPKHIDSVELNPAAHKYAIENVKINKMTALITPLKADAKTFLASCKKKYDRILLAWPGHADPYLDAALACVKKGGMLHFYDFAREGEFDTAAQKVRASCTKKKRRCTIISIVACGQKEPHVNRVCVDAKLS